MLKPPSETTAERRQRDLDELRVNPNPRLVWMIDYAIDEISARLHDKDEYRNWLDWAVSWKGGQRSPQQCVNLAHKCFEHKGWGLDGKGTNPVWHTLGQIAWGAKEACYSTPTSGWLVIRYIADAMLSFGVEFPSKAVTLIASSDDRAIELSHQDNR